MARLPLRPEPDQVSVVIPTRNRAGLLAQTLRSVAEQTAPVARVIVADDGSTDSTGDLVREAGVTHVRNPNGGWGAAGARNAGLARVQTEYVTFLDSDDLLLPGAIESLLPALRRRPEAPFCFGRGLAAARLPEGWTPRGAIGPDGREVEALLGSLYARNSVPSSGALVRTEMARDIGGWDPAIRFVEDHDFWVRLARHGEPVHVPELVCVYRIHPDNRHTPAIARADAERIIALAEGDPRLLPYVPDRLGVELCEVVIAALKARMPGQALGATSDLLIRRRERSRILRRLLRHFRARRSWGRQGDELWGARPELRDWLASY
jgi:glycosyltransferase involved in cell wall biosynthesis